MKFDRKRKREKWKIAQSVERNYNTRLRQVAKMVGHIVDGLAPDGIVTDLHAIMHALESYSVLLTPWARSVARYMLTDTDRRDKKMWEANSKAMGKAIQTELKYAPTGAAYTKLMEEQVGLIKSIPLDAAERVQHLTTLARSDSTRASTIAKEIQRTTHVSESKARLIARTEASRSAETLKRARAEFAGSEGYIWRSSEDHDVRHSHQEVNGKYFRWDAPPKTDKNLAPYNPGCGPNCRCYADPVLPDL